MSIQKIGSMSAGSYAVNFRGAGLAAGIVKKLMPDSISFSEKLLSQEKAQKMRETPLINQKLNAMLSNIRHEKAQKLQDAENINRELKKLFEHTPAVKKPAAGISASLINPSSKIKIDNPAKYANINEAEKLGGGSTMPVKEPAGASASFINPSSKIKIDKPAEYTNINEAEKLRSGSSGLTADAALNVHASEHLGGKNGQITAVMPYEPVSVQSGQITAVMPYPFSEKTAGKTAVMQGMQPAPQKKSRLKNAAEIAAGTASGIFNITKQTLLISWKTVKFASHLAAGIWKTGKKAVNLFKSKNINKAENFAPQEKYLSQLTMPNPAKRADINKSINSLPHKKLTMPNTAKTADINKSETFAQKKNQISKLKMPDINKIDTSYVKKSDIKEAENFMNSRKKARLPR